MQGRLNHLQIRINSRQMGIRDSCRKISEPTFRFPLLNVVAPKSWVKIRGTYTDDDGCALRDWNLRHHLPIQALNGLRNWHNDIFAGSVPAISIVKDEMWLRLTLER